MKILLTMVSSCFCPGVDVFHGSWLFLFLNQTFIQVQIMPQLLMLLDYKRTNKINLDICTDYQQI